MEAALEPPCLQLSQGPALILVDQIDRDIDAGAEPVTAVIEATVRRARPVILTALAAIFAMVPLTQSEFWAPMAVAIMGGLAVATILTLFFVPALYAAWFRVDRGKEVGADGLPTSPGAQEVPA